MRFKIGSGFGQDRDKLSLIMEGMECMESGILRLAFA